MKAVIFGLTLSSSWGNGHATPYRSIIRALRACGVNVTFYEKNVPYYAQHRDFHACDYCDLVLYQNWEQICARALREAAVADIVILGSYCPEGARIAAEILDLNHPLRVFYDLDTPITLKALQVGNVDYLRREQIPEFDLYLSFTGGRIVRRLQDEFGARCVRPLYGSVDPDTYHRVPKREEFACVLSYMGTYAPDRQPKLDELFLEPARHQEDWQFVLAGSLYPWQWTWPANLRRHEHVAPSDHPALYSSSRATLNLTREDMAISGYCPSGRFFEAAACGTPILTDCWDGLSFFFDVETEVLPVHTSADVLSALALPDGDLQRIAQNARLRTLEEHTGARRAAELLTFCEEARNWKQKFMEVAS